MRWNPFTYNLDYTGTSAAANNTYTQDFVIADWSLAAGLYQLDIQHNLESENVVIELWEQGATQVLPGRLDILNTNTIRIFAPFNPDCRYDGSITVIADNQKELVNEYY